MRFQPTELFGVILVEIELHADERGLFARTFCREEFAAHGLNPEVVQCNLSFNHRRGTLRGLHYQAPPHEEAKLVRCVRGAIFDVVVDIREGSPTWLQWIAVELTEDARNALYIPEGFAHGYYTLRDDSEVLYQMSNVHHSNAARGLRWDDPRLGIRWPGVPEVIAVRDGEYAFLGLNGRPEVT